MTTEAEFRSVVLPFTLRFEGGFSTVRQDPGNWTGGRVGRGVLKGTNFGIAASSHPSLDIRHLTLAQAGTIYWDEYCVRPGFDRLALPVQQVTFDAGVNSGPGRAHGWQVQAATLPVPRQVRTISALRLRFCRQSPHWADFGKGWSARIAACELRALKLAAPVIPQRPVPAATPVQPPKGPIPVKKAALSMFALLAAALGFSTAAHAADIAVAPYAVQAIDSIAAPLFVLVKSWVVLAVGLTARHYVSQAASNKLADNVNQALSWAISAGVKEAESKITEEGFVFRVDGIVANFAVQYAQSEFPDLMKKAGGLILNKVQARLPAHPDLLELKANAHAAHVAAQPAARAA